MYQSLVQSNSESAEYKKLLLEIETRLAESEKASKPGSTGISESPARTISHAPQAGP